MKPSRPRSNACACMYRECAEVGACLAQNPEMRYNSKTLPRYWKSNLEQTTLTTQEPIGPVFILYHANCTDGLGARYAAWKKFGENATYIPVKYKQPFPEIIPDGSAVYIVDFSYPRAVLEEQSKRVFLKVLDHHKTAQEDLAGLPYAEFDMERSGAVMAWEYFHPHIPAPDLLLAIQDRDIWKWQREGTRDALATLKLVGDDVTEWGPYMNPAGFSTLVKKGGPISEYQDREVDFSVKPEKVSLRKFRGYDVAVVNCTHLTSEVGNKLCTEYDIDFAICYSITGEGRVLFSFRSIGDFDTTPIAKSFGGGGHKNASGGEGPLSCLQSFYW